MEKSSATGFYGPNVYLENGGNRVGASPEFYWDLEVKRLSSQFHPSEKLRRVILAANDETYNPAANTKLDATNKADLDDFLEAQKLDQLPQSDFALATQQHEAARAVLARTDSKSSEPLPAETDSEFSDYHRGAWAWRRGQDHWDEARVAWEKLLQRPPAERHYRTVWATFMLGKLTMKLGDYPAAVNWFQQTRELAREGFADSLGMAADSHGWEGRCQWKAGHSEKAAALFLTQLALGDDSAVVSLKALIPDRSATEGMLNYDLPDQQKTAADLLAAASNPLLQKLVTMHILATGTSDAYIYEGNRKAAETRATHWLAMVREAKLKTVEDAEYLGWVAYSAGKYDEAVHWLELAEKDAPASCWLRAKLQWRAGKLAEAAQTMAQAWKAIQDNATSNETISPANDASFSSDAWNFSFATEASGDLASLHLQRGDFVQAMDMFLQGKLWNDAAYLAERVLTADELKTYVDNPQSHSSEELRYLLGRRFVREDRYSEASSYLKPPYDLVLKKYVTALDTGANEKLTKAERARGWFQAAWIARHHGMEIMGTEVAPDDFVNGGEFEEIDTAKERLAGFYEMVSYSDDSETKSRQPLVLKASRKEIARLTENKIHPDLRYHYRLVAAGLAMRAAALLPNDTEELADVINTAGLWTEDRDAKTADRYYQILEKRAAATKIGVAVIAKGRFVKEGGPWREEQTRADEAMRAELKIISE